MAPHRYCGSDMPINYYSNSQSINIRFNSDAEIQKGGFKLMAKSADGKIFIILLNGLNYYKFHHFSSVCDRNYNATQGRLVSKETKSCETYINAPANHTISLYFTAFNYYLSDVNCIDDNTPIEVSLKYLLYDCMRKTI